MGVTIRYGKYEVLTIAFHAPGGCQLPLALTDWAHHGGPSGGPGGLGFAVDAGRQ